MYKIINVVYTTRKMNALEVSKLTKYAFICDIPQLVVTSYNSGNVEDSD